MRFDIISLLIFRKQSFVTQDLCFLAGALFWVFIFSTGITACKSGSSGPGADGRPPISVQTVTVTPTPIPRSLPAIGSLKSPKTTELAAERAGKVVFLDIPEGQEVPVGHVLARVDYEQALKADNLLAPRSSAV